MKANFSNFWRSGISLLLALCLMLGVMPAVAMAAETEEVEERYQYTVTKDSYLLAMGDGTAVSESYVDKLAEEIGVDFVNLSEDGLIVENSFTILEENAALFKKADLITIGYSNNTFIEIALDIILDGGYMEMDWVRYLGEEGAAEMAGYLEEIHAYLVESGFGYNKTLDLDMADATTTLIECFTYNCLSYILNLPVLIERIHEINPNAGVIIVGMYNALEGVTIVLDNGSMDINEYLNDLLDLADEQARAYAQDNQNVFYAEARDVETNNDKTEMPVTSLIMAYTRGTMYPSDEGHTYIKDQIMKVLDIRIRLKGDANGDGIILANDALMVLQLSVSGETLSPEVLAVCDMNGDGFVLANDAMLILRASVGGG